MSVENHDGSEHVQERAASAANGPLTAEIQALQEQTEQLQAAFEGYRRELLAWVRFQQEIVTARRQEYRRPARRDAPPASARGNGSNGHSLPVVRPTA